MCGNMVDIQSATAENKPAKKKEERQKPQLQNIMSASATQGGHNHQQIAATLRGSRPGVQSASLYDNFCKTGNDVIYNVIIWVQDGNCKNDSSKF